MSADDLNNADALDPVVVLRKSLFRWRLLAILFTVLSVVTIVGSVTTVWYTGGHSLTAFKDLPKYQVSKLTIDYRDVVKTIDASNESTVKALAKTGTQYVLYDSRQLVAQVLASEQQFADDIAQYAESVSLVASDIGGALEWNRHFQRQAKQLVDRSKARQSGLQAFFDRFPKPNLPELDAQAAQSAEHQAAPKAPK